MFTRSPVSLVALSKTVLSGTVWRCHIPQRHEGAKCRGVSQTRARREPGATPDELLSTPVVPGQKWCLISFWNDIYFWLCYTLIGTHSCKCLCGNRLFDMLMCCKLVWQRYTTSEFYCTFVLLQMEKFASSYFKWKSTFWSIKEWFVFHFCSSTVQSRNKEWVLTSLPKIPRKVELPVEILEGLSEQMK